MEHIEYTKEYLELMARNIIRVQEAKDKMGKIWIGHPDNFVTRKRPHETKILTNQG